MKFRLDNHINGKVYDLTQENMNEMIRIIENLIERRDAWLEEALNGDDKIQKLQQTVLDFQSRYQGALERIEQLTMDVSRLKVQNDKYRDALEFTLKAAEYLYHPDKPIHKGLDPTFYHTLTYEGDMELVEKTKKAREALKGGE